MVFGKKRETMMVVMTVEAVLNLPERVDALSRSLDFAPFGGRRWNLRK